MSYSRKLVSKNDGRQSISSRKRQLRWKTKKVTDQVGEKLPLAHGKKKRVKAF